LDGDGIGEDAYSIDGNNPDPDGLGTVASGYYDLYPMMSPEDLAYYKEQYNGVVTTETQSETTTSSQTTSNTTDNPTSNEDDQQNSVSGFLFLITTLSGLLIYAKRRRN
ncbi:MAG: hypothetical protein ACXAC7_08440, partial [Candidatus Hodarchaeales archaeon]